jgi:serine/threonine protein kinase
MLQGLLHIYSQGFSHRDLKPENILLTNDYNVKLVDFGFACKLEARDGSGFSRSVVGTPGYMAPEVLAKKPYQGHYADLFSLGVILFAMYSGHPPFDLATPTDNYYSLIYRNRIEEFWNKHQKHHPAGFFSESFIDLMSMIFQAEPCRRPVIADIIGHEWLQDGPTATEIEAQDEMMRRRQIRLTKAQLHKNLGSSG